MIIVKKLVLLFQIIQNFVVIPRITQENVPESFNALALPEGKISSFKVFQFYEILDPWE